jgi:hypothetical protein
MPDQDRSVPPPFGCENEPQLQRAVLERLIAICPERISFPSLIQEEIFRGRDRMALLGAVKSLHIDLLVIVDGRGDLVASSTAEHCHWLLTKVEPLNV